ncbi:SAM-dependent methyltransferase [Amycolatopsis sp.]|uniref:SAM-dependent methyltransferase n=1 Tax=Amycolatopsis sp. TaxID=37632 RepID=UPI002CD916F8|nr:SAM-dependent methyltransferase [Amycolatopsis sp.]HVV09824.1 SAM-dependent methyltransferase [Amycolatopsis sp.]
MPTEPDSRPHGPHASDPTVATAARVYDYMLGGTHNYPVDRAAGAQTLRSFPLATLVARYNREFLQRAVRFLTGAGVRQFLDLGSGIPTAGNVHEIAQADAPGSRVVYVDYEEDAVAFGREILAGDADTRVLHADLREPDAVLDSPEVSGLLDFGKPVAVLMVSVLHFVTDDAEALEVVRRYTSRLVPGSYFALSHLAPPENSDRSLALQRETNKVYNSSVAENLAIRSRAQVREFFGDAELVPPGLVLLPDWRPEDPSYLPDDEDASRQMGVAGVGRIV